MSAIIKFQGDGVTLSDIQFAVDLAACVKSVLTTIDLTDAAAIIDPPLCTADVLTLVKAVLDMRQLRRPT